jgi:hypothetical protein
MRRGGEKLGESGGGEEGVYVFDDASTCTSVPALQDPLDEVSPYCKLYFDLLNVWIQQIY